MFCKWCGKTIQPTDVRCPACGRETPPVADCGGFYNLRHSKKQTSAAQPQPVPGNPAPRPAQPRKNAKRSPLLAVLLGITMLCLIVVIIGQLQMRKQIQQLQTAQEEQLQTQDQIRDLQKAMDEVCAELGIERTVPETAAPDEEEDGAFQSIGEAPEEPEKPTEAPAEPEPEDEVSSSAGKKDDGKKNESKKDASKQETVPEDSPQEDPGENNTAPPAAAPEEGSDGQGDETPPPETPAPSAENGD